MPPGLGPRYRSGDRVCFDGVGIVRRPTRRAGQVGGRTDRARRTRLALLRLPGSPVGSAVRRSAAGNPLLIGYVTVDPSSFDAKASVELLRRDLPAPLVPKLAVVDAIPRADERQDRPRRPPWPLPSGALGARRRQCRRGLRRDGGFIAEHWEVVLGTARRPRATRTSSTSAATAWPPPSSSRGCARRSRSDRRRHLRTQTLAARPGARCHVHPAGSPQPRCRHRAPARPARPGGRHDRQPLGRCAALAGVDRAGQTLSPTRCSVSQWLPGLPWWLLTLGNAPLLTPPGRMALAAFQRPPFSPRGVGPGARAAARSTRVWLAERIADELGATNLSGAGLIISAYARGLGARIGADVDLHRSRRDRHASISGPAPRRAEVDLRGHWIDGAHFIPARSGCAPGPRRIALDAPAGPTSASVPRSPRFRVSAMFLPTRLSRGALAAASGDGPRAIGRTRRHRAVPPG